MFVSATSNPMKREATPFAVNNRHGGSRGSKHGQGNIICPKILQKTEAKHYLYEKYLSCVQYFLNLNHHFSKTPTTIFT